MIAYFIIGLAMGFVFGGCMMLFLILMLEGDRK